jgi:hypothetical protein
VLAVDDIRNAFDNVRIDDVLSACSTLLPDLDPQLLEVMGHILRGGEPQRRIGIDQGSPLSPLALNTVLHLAHDVPMGKATNPLWLRYADNLVYPANSVQEGRRRLQHAARILRRAHLSLKGEDGVTDLRHSQAHVLGFTLSLSNGRPQLGLDEESWQWLAHHLQDAHTAHDPNETACQKACGWVESIAPAIHPGGTELVRVLQTAADLGFRDCLSLEKLEEHRQSAYRRWQDLQPAVAADVRRLRRRLSAAPPPTADAPF